MRESGSLDRIFQQYAVSKDPDNEPSTIDVSMVTVAPILVILAAGYVIGNLVLFIERFAHGITFKCLPRGRVRRRRQNEKSRTMYI